MTDFLRMTTGIYACVRVDHGSPFYRQLVDLRHRVLRAPLGLSFTQEELQAEVDSVHLACLAGSPAGSDEAQLAGCVVLVPVEPTTLKLRQMAVEPSYQGKGVGQFLLKEAEALAKARGDTHLTLHARETALGFYQKAGYRVEGSPFTEVTLPHYSMAKIV